MRLYKAKIKRVKNQPDTISIYVGAESIGEAEPKLKSAINADEKIAEIVEIKEPLIIAR